MRTGPEVLLLVLPFMTVAMLTTELDPNGKNVCIGQESFTVTVDVEERYKRQYRTSEWCFSVPPRCSVYKWEWATRKVPTIVNKTREVTQCCQGYEPNGTECKATCKKPCRHGVCTLPDICTCFPGFWRPQCQDICSRGSWGNNCSQNCNCFNDAFCNPMNGACLCTPGWRGSNCNEPCKEGFFGFECRRPCYCEGFPCHHITGECFIPSTLSTTDSTSTTQITTSQEPWTTTTDASSTSSRSMQESTSTTRSNLITDLETRSITTTSEPSSTPISLTTKAVTNFVGFSPVSSTFTYTETSTEMYHFYSNSTIEDKGNWTTEPELEQVSNTTELASLAMTIAFSVLGSLIFLFAAAGLALARHRKLPAPVPAGLNTDTGLYRFYAEEPLPAKAVFLNPTYGCPDLEVTAGPLDFQSFKLTEDTFETELRDIIEAQYDQPPVPISRSSTPFDHLYAEIDTRTNFTMDPSSRL